MSKTPNKSYAVKARQGNVLNLTKNGNIRLNATRRNPRADEEGQKATLPMYQMYDYIYMLTGKVDTIMPNGSVEQLDIIKGFTFKPIDGMEITGYISDIPVDGTTETQLAVEATVEANMTNLIHEA